MRQCTNTWVLDKQSVTRCDMTRCDRVEGLQSMRKFSQSNKKNRFSPYNKKKIKGLYCDRR